MPPPPGRPLLAAPGPALWMLGASPSAPLTCRCAATLEVACPAGCCARLWLTARCDRVDPSPGLQVSGQDAPEGISSFEDVDLPPALMENVKRCKYTKPTPVQRYSIPIGLAGRDMMACAQTGSGKTAAFCFPIIANILRSGEARTPRHCSGVAGGRCRGQRGRRAAAPTTVTRQPAGCQLAASSCARRSLLGRSDPPLRHPHHHPHVPHCWLPTLRIAAQPPPCRLPAPARLAQGFPAGAGAVPHPRAVHPGARRAALPCRLPRHAAPRRAGPRPAMLRLHAAAPHRLALPGPWLQFRDLSPASAPPA